MERDMLNKVFQEDYVPGENLTKTLRKIKCDILSRVVSEAETAKNRIEQLEERCNQVILELEAKKLEKCAYLEDAKNKPIDFWRTAVQEAFRDADDINMTITRLTFTRRILKLTAAECQDIIEANSTEP